jgi:hypothetical protein
MLRLVLWATGNAAGAFGLSAAGRAVRVRMVGGNMSNLDTREAVRGLANMVKVLAISNRHLNRNGLALVTALEKIHPGVEKAYLEATETPPAMPGVDRLIDNIEALLRQLEEA